MNREFRPTESDRLKVDSLSRRWANLFEQAPSFIAILDGAEHRIVLANARFMTLLEDRAVLGRTVAEALPDAVEHGYLAHLDRVFSTGQAYLSSGARYAVRPFEEASPAERFVDFVYQPIADDAGRVTGIFVEGTDVTDRVRAEQQLQNSQARLREANQALENLIQERTAQLNARETLIRTFYEHSAECHAVLRESGPDFVYEEINPATLRLYGKQRDEVIGRTLEHVLGPAAAAFLAEHFRVCLAENAPHRYERHERDGIVEAVATPVPVQSDGGRLIVVSARDVTERRRLEQQLLQSQKMEAVGQLTGGLAHDFNNLLTGITGSLQLVQNRITQGRLNDLDRYITAGQGAARRAAALTHRLLAFSRRQTLEPKPTDVNRLIADWVDLVRRTVGPAISVELIGAVGLWTTAVDSNQLENALLNLCINARDAMPDGGKITIETANRWIDARMSRERDLPQGHYISICVSDDGCGMPPHVVSRVFEPFFTTKPLGEGTGLGLSMIYGFARQSGGQVRLYSEVGRGTMVCLYLPRHVGKNEAVEDVLEPEPVTGSAQGETVLVVDDEPTVRMLVTEVLEDLGFAAIESVDGVAALKVLETNRRIDLLVTDVGLPNGINGRQLADAARVLRPNLKVLFITGYAENAVFSHGHLRHGFEVLTKPFAIDVLANRILGLIKSG